jgi:hypothetical protein
MKEEKEEKMKSWLKERKEERMKERSKQVSRYKSKNRINEERKLTFHLLTSISGPTRELVFFFSVKPMNPICSPSEHRILSHILKRN